MKEKKVSPLVAAGVVAVLLIILVIIGVKVLGPQGKYVPPTAAEAAAAQADLQTYHSLPPTTSVGKSGAPPSGAQSTQMEMQHRMMHGGGGQ